LRDPNSTLTDILDFDLVPAHAERPEDRHLVGELIDQCRLRAVPELHFGSISLAIFSNGAVLGDKPTISMRSFIH
jgi:hypothetical protein